MKSLVTILFLIMSMSKGAWAEKVCLKIEGMTCSTCAITVKAAVKKLNGIQEAKASVEKKNASIQFDPKLTNVEAIERAIDDTGFEATVDECKSIEG